MYRSAAQKIKCIADCQVCVLQARSAEMEAIPPSAEDGLQRAKKNLPLDDGLESNISKLTAAESHPMIRNYMNAKFRGMSMERARSILPEERFSSPEPEVHLEKAFPTPFRNSIATAKTCYSSKGIIRDEQVQDGFEPMAKSIYKAGHHTTLQHAHFQFTLANVSRQFLWSFLHSHPYYNSEQVSQRYVAVRPDHFAIPPMPDKARQLFIDTVNRQVDTYEQLVLLLSPKVLQEYLKRFPHHDPQASRVQRTIRRKAQETARYVLPVATFAYLYHTVSGITLLRYWRMCSQYDTPLEQRLVVGKMVEALLEHDPEYAIVLEENLPLESTPEAQFLSSSCEPSELSTRQCQFRQEFDQSLEGRISKLVDYKINSEEIVAAGVREVLGLSKSALSDEEAIELVLSPARNPLLAEAMNVNTHSKLGRVLFHAAYTFRKKLSHAADSQDQRHRMTPASRPVLSRHVTSEPDYVLPVLVKEVEAAEELYHRSMKESWESLNRLEEWGVPREFSMYLLPNALSIRFTESADLLNLHHKLAMRLCYNAQEEIWRASLDEARQIEVIHPRIGKYLLPPCGLHKLAKVKPICPEGERFCGERVWLYALEEFERVI